MVKKIFIIENKVSKKLENHKRGKTDKKITNS
jgi:hypothetical protein